MRIGLNLLYLLPGVVGGTQTYAVELIRALVGLDSENEYLLFLNRESADLEIAEAPNLRRLVCPVRAASRERRYAWEQIVLPGQLRRHKVDLLHSLGYVGPLRPGCPHVVSIYDLIYVGHSGFMSARKRKTLEFFVTQVARRSQRILTTSESSKQQIVDNIGVPEQKVTVIHGAARPRHAPNTQPDTRAVLEQYGIRRPYLIAFSSFNPVKNMSRLIQAFAQANADSPHQLVLVGHIPEGTDLHAEATRTGLAGRVVITGFVPDEHIPPLLQNADLFAFPSFYEGFGLPLLDAQQAGVPIICSNASSLPEVAGDSALFFDPASVDEMAAAIRACFASETRREELRQKGYANLKRFSWEQTARQTLEAYRQVAVKRERNSL